MSAASGEVRAATSGPLLSMRGVSRDFVVRRDLLGRPREVVHAVDDVTLDVGAGTTLGIVGESGSGKSTLGRLALRLVEADRGEIDFAGRDLRAQPPSRLRALRPDMSMIFQDPYSALNPRWTVGRSIAEPLRAAGVGDAAGHRSAVAEMLGLVGLDADVIDRRPQAFSGGQRQRIVIARALILRPSLVFCDEPVSALDVSTRAQVLRLLRDLQRELALTYLFVSHDLGIVAAMSDRIAVMYLGSIVEEGPAEAVSGRYRHPYTASLVSAAPAPDPVAQRGRRRLILAGDPPSPIDPPPGCAFHPRCPLVQPICTTRKPELRIGPDGHAVACHVTADEPRLFGEALLSRMTGTGIGPVAKAAPAGPASTIDPPNGVDHPRFAPEETLGHRPIAEGTSR